MSNLTLKEAEEKCVSELEAAEEAFNDHSEAEEQLDNARSQLEEERSVWDESTFYTVGGAAFVVGGILACLIPEPSTKLICAGGIASITGGAAGAAGSEIDRRKDIEDAEDAVEAAEKHVDKTREALDRAREKSRKCVSHHLIKVEPLEE